MEDVDPKSLIANHEGLRLKPYRCSEGKLTIGYGHNLDDRGITKKEADFLLDNDIKQSEYDLRLVFGDLIDKTDVISENRYAALLDMMFNLGINRFEGFTGMIAAIKANDWPEAARQALDSKWAQQVGNRAIEDAKLLEEG